MKLPNQIGLKYGRLTITNRNKVGQKFYCECICDCGNYTNVEFSHLRCGHTKSCGCARVKDIRSSSELGMCWRAIIHRCYTETSKAYKNYGGRGIKCEWTSFDEFYNDMFPTWRKYLELDRINNDGNYSKNNCRWVTTKQNCNNKQNTRYYKGEPLTLVCERLGLNRKSIYSRLFKGWNINDAIEIPLNFKKGNKYKK